MKTRILNSLLAASLVLVCSAAVARPDTAFRVGGENGGGTGVWVLPRAHTLSMAAGSVGDVEIGDESGTLLALRNGWQSDGSNLWLGVPGAPFAVAVDFENASLSSGVFLDIFDPLPKIWRR